MSHSLLRPEFSSPRLEAISISWPSSYWSRWQLMPTNLSHEALFFGIRHLWNGCDWNKDNTAKKNYIISGMSLLGFFFFNRKDNITILLFQHDLAPITSMISFPTFLPLMLQAYLPPYCFSDIPSMVSSQCPYMSQFRSTLSWCLYVQDLVSHPSLGICSKVTLLEIIPQIILYKIVLLQFLPFLFPITLPYFSH